MSWFRKTAVVSADPVISEYKYPYPPVPPRFRIVASITGNGTPEWALEESQVTWASFYPFYWYRRLATNIDPKVLEAAIEHLEKATPDSGA